MNKGPIRLFDEEHGESVHVGNMIYYADGASRENSSFPAMHSPPYDPFERARKVIFFHEQSLAKEREKFDKFKSALQLRGDATDDEVAHLKALQRKVKHHQRKLEEAQDDVKPANPHAIRWRREVVNRDRFLTRELAALENFKATIDFSSATEAQKSQLQQLRQRVYRSKNDLRFALRQLESLLGALPQEFEQLRAEDNETHRATMREIAEIDV